MREALARSDRDFLASDEEAPSRLLSAVTFLLRRPLEVAGSLVMAGFSVLIIVNALALQTGPHPAPFLHQAAALPEAADAAPAMPPARNAAPVRPAADSAATDLLRRIQSALAARGLYDGTADGLTGPRTDAAIRAVQTRIGLAVDGQPSEDLLARIAAIPQTPPARPGDAIAALINAGASAASGPAPPVPAGSPSRRVLAVEQALASLGYGPLKVDGIMDADTRGAISRFEQDQRLPVTGEVNGRLTRELTKVSGIPLP